MKNLVKNEQQIQHLLVVDDKQGKRVIKLEDSTCSIGRDSTNSIVLHSKLVSRQHAILLRISIPETASYSFRLIDGNLQGDRSTNGIIINGQRCFSHDLKPSDVIVFAGDVEAKYYASHDLSEVDLLTFNEAEDLSDLLSGLSNPFQTLIGENIESKKSNKFLINSNIKMNRSN